MRENNLIRSMMKKGNICLLLSIILINGCFSEKHLEFETIPINGSLDIFADELIKLGFNEAQSTKENQLKLNGVFFGKECEIYVDGTGKTQTAYKVTVNMPVEVMDSLVKSYGEMQKLYKLKYGNGTSRYQQYKDADRFLFNEPKRTRRLSKGDFTRYRTKSGIIILEVREGYVSVNYSDKLNTEIMKSEME